MSLFNQANHLELLKFLISQKPLKGRGEAKKMASHLGISSVLMSQILSGKRTISEEHAYKLASYFSMSSPETEYFLLLVKIERAGTQEYRKYLDKKLESLVKDSSKVKNRIEQDAHLSEQTQAIFYSHWKYSLIRLACSLESVKTRADLTSILANANLDLPLREISSTLDFLVQHGLCEDSSDGLTLGPQRTHLNADSAFFYPRQIQWRNLAIQRLNKPDNPNLFFTAPFSASTDDIQWLRQTLLDTISALSKKVEKTKPKKLACVNLDLFEII